MHITSLTMSTNENPTNKLMESTASDSGFLSGACTTESDLSVAASACDLGAASPGSYIRLDSGVDVSESMSQLNLDERPLHGSVQLSKHFTDPAEYPPWEYFFAPDENGDTQLHIGVIQGYVDAVETLISLVPHPSVLDFQNDLCQTPLHLAVLSKQSGIVRRLVAAGASVEMRDRNGNTPLHLAAQLGDLNSVQALTVALSAEETQTCELRYKPVAQSLPQQLDLPNFDGQAPIHLAALAGQCDVIRALLWLGTDVNLPELKGGRTALHYAVETRNLKAVRCLAESRCNFEAESYSGLTPYQLASDLRSPIANELLLLGANPLPLASMDDSDSDCDAL